MAAAMVVGQSVGREGWKCASGPGPEQNGSHGRPGRQQANGVLAHPEVIEKLPLIAMGLDVQFPSFEGGHEVPLAVAAQAFARLAN